MRLLVDIYTQDNVMQAHKEKSTCTRLKVLRELTCMSVSTVLLEADVEFEKCTFLVLQASKVKQTKIIAQALTITSCTYYSHSVPSAFPFS